MVLISIRFMARKDGPAGVSVPLRGLWFLSRGKQQRTHRNVLQFPSPCGDYGSYHWLSVLNGYVMAAGFRPLAGIMVLIFIYDTDDSNVGKFKFPSPCGDYGSYRNLVFPFRSLPLSFPSPCGDYGSYQSLASDVDYPKRGSFRPLAGIMVLIPRRKRT